MSQQSASSHPAGGATSDAAVRRAIDDELQRVEESARFSAQSQFEQAKQWRALNLLLGIPASVLAALSGAATLAETAGRLPAGVLALAAAAFGATLTTLNAAHRFAQAQSSANEFLGIQTAARQARLVDLPTQPIDQARAALGNLTTRLDEQRKVADPPNRWAYRRGQRNIRADGQTYEVDRQRPTPGPRPT
jgi:hypothetical protein